MLRLRLICLAFATLIAAGCSDDPITAERALPPPTARPADPIAGDMADGFAPGADDEVAVVGVAIGGSLPLRIFPGIDQAVIARIPPTETGLYGFGQTFETEDGRTWWMVRWGDEQGWIEPGAAYLGAPRDISDTIAASLPAATFASPGDLIDAALAELPPNPIIVEQRIDAAGGTAVATIDLIAIDDAQRGRRVVITMSGSGATWQFGSAEERALCRRGLTELGGCR